MILDSGWITPQEQVSIINGIVMKNDMFICLGDVGRLFKHSTQRGINSAEFIKVFMKSATSKALDKQTVELAFDIFKHKIKQKWHLKNVLERAIIFITEGHELLLTRHCSLVFTLIYASESW